MHHEPLDAAGDATESAPLPRLCKIVADPTLKLSLCSRDLSAMELSYLCPEKTALSSYIRRIGGPRLNDPGEEGWLGWRRQLLFKAIAMA